MKFSKFVSFVTLILIFLTGGCQASPAESSDLGEVTQTNVIETETVVETATVIIPTETENVLPTETKTSPATPTPYSGPVCYTDDVPYAYAESAGVLGWKYFTDREGIETRVIYFPPTCSLDNMERDVESLFYQSEEGELSTLILLDSYTSGRLGQLYAHLDRYEFWAMGPEDYPMVLNAEEGLNSNLVFLRIDRLNGEGYEGNEILGRMVGLAEHEFIHTVQAKNNESLADMIWSDDVYRAFIERYANLNNNSGGRYYMAPYSYLSLLQMLDGLYYQGLLPEIVNETLIEMDVSPEDYLTQELTMYDSHIQQLVVSTAGESYLTHLTQDDLNPLLLITSAGVGDLTSYELLRTIYDEHIDEYNLWYYGVEDTNYLPDSFDILFEPTS